MPPSQVKLRCAAKLRNGMSAVEPAEYARRFHQMVSTTRLQPQALAPRPSLPTLILEPRPHPYSYLYPCP